MTCYRLYGSRTPFRSSAGRIPVEERGQQSASVNTVTFSNLPPLRRRLSGLMAAADRASTGRDRTTNCTVDYSLCPHFGRARSGDLSNATPVTRSSLRRTASLGPVHGRTNRARPTYWALPAIDRRNTSSYFHPSTIGQVTTCSPDVFAVDI